jgi:L-ribulose-5-phosphate 4-epimerase
VRLVLVRGHGRSTMGCDPAAAVVAVVALEVVAETALLTQLLDPGGPLLPPFLTQRHFSRKHGAGAYYGQPR